MTPLGYGTLPVGVGLLVLGILTAWEPVAMLGTGLLLLFAGSALHVLRRPPVRLERAVEPPQVEKGQPAIAVIRMANIGRRAVAALAMEQRLGDRSIETRLPRLHRGESGVRTYRLPTDRRGTYEIGPVELPRADPFGLWRRVQRMGEPQRITVRPRVLPLHPLPTGVSRNLEGPSSDSSPQGSVTFHRLREYVLGDDLRNVHWPSTARTGQLIVRHNVDTAQPYTVVLLDLDASRYSAESFEEAVDAAASVSVSMASGKAPVQLRTTSGDRLGGPSNRDPAAILDFLTEVRAVQSEGLEAELVLLGRDRGGTALVVVTGPLDPSALPGMTALRRRFDRVVVVSVVERAGHVPPPRGITVLEASTAAEAARRWNSMLVR